MPRKPLVVLAVLVLLVAVAPPVRADDEAILRAARTSYREGADILKRSRDTEGDERQEASERALNLFRAAQQLLEPIADSNPAAMDMMAEVQGLIYWTHKMTPLAPSKRDEIAQEFEKEQEQEIAAAAPAATPESARDARERIAREKLGAIRDAEKSNPDSLEILARYFRLADEWSDTRAGIEANGESIRLQKVVWGGGEGKEAESEGDWERLEQRVKNYLTLRKRAACHKCDGEFIVPCEKCGGTGWHERYYGGGTRTKIDWSHTKQCVVCNPDGINTGGEPRNGPNAGRSPCTQTGCYHGFNYRHFEKVVLDYRPPAFRERIAEKLNGAPLEVFAKALAIRLRPNEQSGAPDDFAELCAQYGQDESLIRAVVDEHLRESLGHVFTKWDKPRITEGDNEVKVVLEFQKNRKTIRTFRETMKWVWIDDEWYCEEPEE